MNSEKIRIERKAMRLARKGERVGFMVEEGKGDYTLYPTRLQAHFRRMAKKYMKDDNWKMVTLEHGGGDYGWEEITVYPVWGR